MKQALVYAVVAAAVIGSLFLATSSNKDEFQTWKTKFSIEFTESENLYRSIVFYKNLATIAAHNSNEKRTYDMGLNQFSALTDEEFASLYLAPKPYNPEWENADV
jgi:hypothetical protein